MVCAELRLDDGQVNDMFPLGNIIVFRNIHYNTLQMSNECFNCPIESLLAHILSKNS